MNKPKLLDLFCGAGGASTGYYRAGFDVTGVDLHPQKRYPFPFIQADAIEYALSHGWQYDAIHASPPCQKYSQITKKQYRDNHPDLIPHTRFVLQSLGIPYIIENVERARKALHNPVMLCGADFGLKVYRHRLFESNVTLYVPQHFPHDDKTPRAGHGISPKGMLSITSGGNGITQQQLKYASAKGFISIAGNIGGGDYARYAMAIDWMTNAELSQSIPPAFTEYLGRQLMAHLNGEGLPVQQRLWA